MTTHSLPSQTFGAKPLLIGDLFRRLLTGWSAGRTTAHRDGRVEEANRVRIYADSVRSQDPRFAADLMAAADRHERNER